MKQWLFFAVACGLFVSAAVAVITVHLDHYAAQKDKWDRYIDREYSWLGTKEGRTHRIELNDREPYSHPSFPYFIIDVWALGLGLVCFPIGVCCTMWAYKAAEPERRGTRRAFSILLAVLAVLAVGLDCYANYDQQQHDMTNYVEGQLSTEGSNFLHYDPFTAHKNLDQWRGKIGFMGPWVSEARKKAALDLIAHLKENRRQELKRAGWSEKELQLLD
jgi:hypothetical protein